MCFFSCEIGVFLELFAVILTGDSDHFARVEKRLISSPSHSKTNTSFPV